MTLNGTLRGDLPTHRFRRVLDWALRNSGLRVSGSCERNAGSITLEVFARGEEGVELRDTVNRVVKECRSDFVADPAVADALVTLTALPRSWSYEPLTDSPRIVDAKPPGGIPLLTLPAGEGVTAHSSNPSDAHRGVQKIHIVSVNLDTKTVKLLYGWLDGIPGDPHELDRWQEETTHVRVPLPFGKHCLFDQYHFYFAWMISGDEGAYRVSLLPRIMPGVGDEKRLLIEEIGRIEITCYTSTQRNDWMRALAVRKWLTLSYIGNPTRDLLLRDAGPMSACWVG